MNAPEKERKRWLDHPKNITKIFWALAIVCVILGGVDFFYHKHAEFAFEEWYGFYGIFGFLAYMVIIFIAKRFRRIVTREEDYYE